MTGEFTITRDYLKKLAGELGIDRVDMKFFDANYPNGQAAYQDLLDKAAQNWRTDFAEMLLARVGATTDTLKLDSMRLMDLTIGYEQLLSETDME